MAKRKLAPLVQAMNLVNQLDERDKQTLADYIRSQFVRPKSSAPSAAKKSSRKGAAPSPTQSTEDDKGNALRALGVCWICGNEADWQDHFKPSPQFHEFVIANKAKSA